MEVPYVDIVRERWKGKKPERIVNQFPIYPVKRCFANGRVRKVLDS